MVPGAKCFLELVDIEEPLCTGVPMEECFDEVKETPFLVDVQNCTDVPIIVCTEVGQGLRWKITIFIFSRLRRRYRFKFARQSTSSGHP